MLNLGFQELITQPLRGGLKFKIAKNMKAINDAIEIIRQSLVDEKDEGADLANSEVFEQSQELELTMFSEDELEDIEISALGIMRLEKLLEVKGD